MGLRRDLLTFLPSSCRELLKKDRIGTKSCTFRISSNSLEHFFSLIGDNSVSDFQSQSSYHRKNKKPGIPQTS